MASCQIVNGADRVDLCPVWQDYVHTNEIKLWGPKYGNR